MSGTKNVVLAVSSDHVNEINVLINEIRAKDQELRARGAGDLIIAALSMFRGASRITQMKWLLHGTKEVKSA